MNDLLQMILLAVVQGLTEFLPVSSSGHLVLAKHLLGFEAMSGLGVELLLHGGTLVAVLAYYRNFIVEVSAGLFRGTREAWRFAWAVLLSMIPAVVLGLLFEAQLEACAEAVAMLPGVSRSGSTIAMSRFLGVASDKAAAFSFLMVVPVIIGGNALHLFKAVHDHDASAFAGLTWPMGIVGFVVSAFVGYLSVAWMVRLLGCHSFWRFGFYCLAVGLGGLLCFAFGR